MGCTVPLSTVVVRRGLSSACHLRDCDCRVAPFSIVEGEIHGIPEQATVSTADFRDFRVDADLILIFRYTSVGTQSELPNRSTTTSTSSPVPRDNCSTSTSSSANSTARAETLDVKFVPRRGAVQTVPFFEFPSTSKSC
eukprot:976800-Rhodomonas_salina.4